MNLCSRRTYKNNNKSTMQIIKNATCILYKTDTELFLKILDGID